VLAETALARGHSVTTFNRGRSGSDVAGVEIIRGDRATDSDLARLADGGEWDVAIDVGGSEPLTVYRTAEALSARVGGYVFVSTVSVYRDWPESPVDESSPVHPGDPYQRVANPRWDAKAYGPLKSGCEEAVRTVFSPEHLLIVRPGVVVGRYEYVGRLPWWLGRIARGGTVLAPAPPERPIQPVDVRDLAAFLLYLIESHVSGVFNVAAPLDHATYSDLLAACVRVTQRVQGSSVALAWVDQGWLVAQGVCEWTEIPLWRTPGGTWMVDATRAADQGLICRPLASTVADTWSWLNAGGLPVPHERQAEHGIDAEKERRLISAWEHHRGPAADYSLELNGSTPS
jgi:2'-hydroxyisoflavone reductase